MRNLSLNILSKIFVLFSLNTFLLSCSYAIAATGSDSTDVVNAIENLETKWTQSTSRVPGVDYISRDSTGNATTLWIEDFFNIFKYYEIRRDERDAYFFYMRAPSQPYFTSIFSIARQNYMFQPPFSYYDGLSGLSKTVENNYLYIYKLDTYNEFIKPTVLSADSLTDPVTPSEAALLPRAGSSFQTGENVFDELIRTSAIQDMVFKHFYLYCPEGASDSCEAVMNATSGGIFSSDGMGTTRPNADLNPESLLATPSFSINSASHNGARDFIRMITNPYPRMQVPFKPDPNMPGAYIPDTTDVKQIGKNLTDTAYRNLSAHVLNEIKNRRVQSIDPTKGTSSSTGGSLSSFEFLSSLAMDRMLTSNNWLTQMNVTSSEGLLRELVVIQASSLMMQYQMFRQNENIEALLAAIVAQNQNLLDAMNFAPDTAKIQDSIAAVG